MLTYSDESQRVTMDDIGSIDEIRKWADIEGKEEILWISATYYSCKASGKWQVIFLPAFSGK